jgi:hypothetical protein
MQQKGIEWEMNKLASTQGSGGAENTAEKGEWEILVIKTATCQEASQMVTTNKTDKGTVVDDTVFLQWMNTEMPTTEEVK